MHKNFSFLSQQHINLQLWCRMIVWLHEWTTRLRTSHIQHPAAISLTQLSHSASTDVPLPHLVIMTQMSGVGVDTDLLSLSISLSLSVGFFLFFSFFFGFIHFIAPSRKTSSDFYFWCSRWNKSPCGPSPQSHADWPDVTSLIMNISILISRTTIAGWQPQSWYMISPLVFRRDKPTQKPLCGVWGCVLRALLFIKKLNQHIQLEWESETKEAHVECVFGW